MKLNNGRFTVIEGGKSKKNTNKKDIDGRETMGKDPASHVASQDPASHLASQGVAPHGRVLTECYVTNTRLMGVLAMYMRFDAPSSVPENSSFDAPGSAMKKSTGDTLHMFFYFDAEEFGFDNYKSMVGDDTQEVAELRGSIMGGLGGEPQNISLREAVHILKHYVRFNRERGIPMPEGIEEYGFLLNLDGKLSEPDQYILNRKICVRLQNDYEAVNYFLMRCFGKDFEGAKLVMAPGILQEKDTAIAPGNVQNAEDEASIAGGKCAGMQLELFPDYRQGTFCKNIIDEGREPGEYICESLVEFGDCYHLTITKVCVKNRLVCGYERINNQTVSAREAAMMLSRSEFINVYMRVGEPGLVPERSLSKLTEGAMIHNYPDGKLFMIFKPNNNHVAKKEYRLNEDVLGLYYVSETELVCASNSKADIWELEKDLAKSTIRAELKPTSRYEFKEPVIYEYMNSGFESFSQFVAVISGADL